MKKILALILLVCCLPTQAATNDFTKGVDFTGYSGITATLLNQLVDNAVPAANRGMVIIQSTTPDTATSPKFTNYVWIDIGISPPALKAYDPADTSWKSAALGSSSVTSSMIVDNTIEAIDINTNAVTASELSDNAVTSAKIQANAVTVTKINADAVTSAKILDATILADDLAADSVTSAKIVDLTIVTADLAVGSVESTNILDGTIITADIATDAVVATNIVDDAVTLAKLNDGDLAAFQIYRATSAATAVEAVNPGQLQFVYTNISAVTACSVATPNDNTVPVKGEGVEILSVSFTPKSVSSVLVLNFSGAGKAAVSQTVTTCFYKGSTCLKSDGEYFQTDEAASINMTQVIAPATTNAVTISVQIGPNTGTFYLNSNDNTGTSSYGGSMLSTLTITEILN